jgi:hypothetical protein
VDVYAAVGVIVGAAVVAIVLAATNGPILLALLPLVIGAAVLTFLQVNRDGEAG